MGSELRYENLRRHEHHWMGSELRYENLRRYEHHWMGLELRCENSALWRAQYGAICPTRRKSLIIVFDCCSTNSVDHKIFLKATSFSASQIFRTLRNPKYYCWRHKRLPLVPSWSRSTSSSLSLMSINTVPPSAPRSFKWSVSFRFPHQNLHALLFSPIRATCTANLILLYLITLMFREKYE